MPTICDREAAAFYYINEEKRVVVAVLSTDIFEFVKGNFCYNTALFQRMGLSNFC